MKTIIYDDYNKYDEPSGVFLGQSEDFTRPPYAGFRDVYEQKMTVQEC